MTRLSQSLRTRRIASRNRREFDRALQVASPAMRDELLVLAQRQSVSR